MNSPDTADRGHRSAENNDLSNRSRHSATSRSSPSSSDRPASSSDYPTQSNSPAPMADRRPSTASENTPIINGNPQATQPSYQSVQSRDNSGQPGPGAASPAQDTQQGGESSRNGNTAGAGNQPTQNGESPDAQSSWRQRLVENYGALELENKGSVARDHLALERTFLAWLRTSLAFASIGIAVTQLFRLNGSLSSRPRRTSNLETPLLPPSEEEPSSLLEQLISVSAAGGKKSRLANVGKPLGATFIAISILILLIGFHRYFESQYWIVRGKFPASRGSVALVTFVAAALIVTSLVVILAIAPTAIEV